MSRRHRTAIRSFGNGHQLSARFIQTTDLAGYFCDHGAEQIVAQALVGNGCTFSRRNRTRFILDLGGSVMDVDKTMEVRAAGYRFHMWEHQVGDYLSRLEEMKPATDHPQIMILGGRWIRVVVTLATARALRDVLRPLRIEIVKKVQKRDQEFAARMEEINVRLDAKGVVMRMSPARQVEA